jgi:MtfA peptidase
MQTVALLFSLSVVFFIVYNLVKKRKLLSQPALDKERQVLEKHVVFYQQLTVADKKEFEQRVRTFLQKVRIKGIDVEIEDADKVFVAAAAIIPIFAFKGWEYHNIHDVLVYPSSFDTNFKTSGGERDVLGMVGNGPMENQMILSIGELRNGFLNTNSKSNTAIHEFVHLIDKVDGTTDGCPESLLPHVYVLPWLKRMQQEIALIQKGKSDINPYGATDEAEFLAVVSEYFFKQPALMKRKHPELYDLLEHVFLQKGS